MQWMKICSLFLVLLLSLQSIAADNACSMAWKDLVSDAAQVGQKSAAHMYTDSNGVVLRTLRTWRGQLRDFITRANGNRYPVMALDDGTPMKAYVLARDGRRGLPLESIPEGLDAIDLAVVKTEINASLAYVKRYQADLLQIQLDSANQYARKEALKKFLDENKTVTAGVHIEIPVLKWEGKELVYGKTHREYFGQTTDVKNEIRNLERLVKKATRDMVGPFSNNTADMRAVEQAVALKRLETYYKEIQHVESRLAATNEKLAEDVVKIKAKLKALYADPVKESFKPELKPPGVAWFRVRNIQLFSEIKVLFWKKIPKLNEALQENKVFAAVKSMKESERQALFKQLGLNRVATSANILGRSGPATRILALLGAPPAAGAGGKWAWDFGTALFFRKGTAKECARTEDDDAFAECLREYVEKEFPGTQLKQYLNKEGMINLSDKTFTDPKVAAAVKSIHQARLDYLEEQNTEREKLGFFKAVAAKDNPNSEEFQKKLVATKDLNVLKKRLLGPDKGYPNGFLGYMYPRGTREGKKIIEELFSLEFGSESFNAKVETLSEINPDLRDMTIRMFELHNYFLNPDQAPPEEELMDDEDEAVDEEEKKPRKRRNQPNPQEEEQ